MTIAYCHSARLIHGAVRDIAPRAVIDPGRDTWSATIGPCTPLTKDQLDEVTAQLVGRLNENEALRAENDKLRSELSALRVAYQAAIPFVPRPEEMGGYDDPDAPEEVLECIERAKKARTAHEAAMRNTNQESQ